MATAKSSKSDPSPPNPFGIPGLDLSKAYSQFGLPSVNFDRLGDEQRENIEAVRQANQSVMSGWEALDNMRALAEIASEYQNEAYEIVRKRMEENIEGHFGAQARKNE